MYTVELISPTAKMPTKSNERDSGWDVYSDESVVLYPGERKLISTGLKIQIDREHPTYKQWESLFIFELQVRPKSGRAHKEGLTIVNTPGTVDEPYCDKIFVNCLNIGQNWIEIKQGQKLAQIVPTLVLAPAEFNEVSAIDSSFDRGGGHGSTGL